MGWIIAFFAFIILAIIAYAALFGAEQRKAQQYPNKGLFHAFSRHVKACLKRSRRDIECKIFPTTGMHCEEHVKGDNVLVTYTFCDGIQYQVEYYKGYSVAYREGFLWERFGMQKYVYFTTSRYSSRARFIHTGH